MKVVFVDHAFNAPASFVQADADTDANKLAGKEAMVVAFSTKPGKEVALCMKEGGHWHSCDGLVPPGRGRWARPEQLYTMEAYIAHREAAKEAKTEALAIAKLVEAY